MDCPSTVSDLFSLVLYREESDELFELKSKFESSDALCLLFKAITKVLGLRFTPQAQKEFSTNPLSFCFEKPFDDTDLEVQTICLLYRIWVNV